MTGERWRGPSKDGVPPQSVGRVLWRAKPSGGTAPRRCIRISDLVSSSLAMPVRSAANRKLASVLRIER